MRSLGNPCSKACTHTYHVHTFAELDFCHFKCNFYFMCSTCFIPMYLRPNHALHQLWEECLGLILCLCMKVEGSEGREALSQFWMQQRGSFQKDVLSLRLAPFQKNKTPDKYGYYYGYPSSVNSHEQMPSSLCNHCLKS